MRLQSSSESLTKVFVIVEIYMLNKCKNKGISFCIESK